MGALHPYEQALTVALAFGPFLVLGLVVWRRRRAEAAEEARAESTADPTDRPRDGTPAATAEAAESAPRDR